MVFVACATAIAIAAPSSAMLAATATDAVLAVIFDVSRADSRMLAGGDPGGGGPVAVDRRLHVGRDLVQRRRARTRCREAEQPARDRDRAGDDQCFDRLVRQRLERQLAAGGHARAVIEAWTSAVWTSCRRRGSR